MVHEPAFDELKKRRYAVLEVSLKDGAQWLEKITAIRGSAANPMATAEVEGKAAAYIGAVLGEDRARMLIEKMRGLEAIDDIRVLREYIA